MDCDGKSALDSSITALALFSSDPGKYHSEIKQFEVIHSIIDLLNESPIQWTLGHVYGHQDDFVVEEDLNIWSHLNINSDTHTKAFLQDIHEQQLPIAQSFP